MTVVSHFQSRNLISLRSIRGVGFRLPHGRTPIENDGQSIAQSSAHVDLRDVQQITSFAVVGLGGSTVYPSFTWSAVAVRVALPPIPRMPGRATLPAVALLFMWKEESGLDITVPTIDRAWTHLLKLKL